MIDLAWVIPLLPLAGFFLIVFFGKRLPGGGAEVAITAVLVGLVMSIAVLAQVAAGHEPVERSLPIAEVGAFDLEFGQYIDGLAAVMLVVVTLVSLCVQVYSTAYMHGDRRYTFYFAALSLFTGSMLNLVIANNLFQLLLGWELVGICSYLLIGHWWEEKENSDAAIKAFITTRTGDVPFTFGIFVLVVAAGTANIPEITHLAEDGELSRGVMTVAALLLFGGAIGKSAQFPLHVWLPDAMAGPTPVSALIHAATMVAAGVYLVGRMFAVFAHSPEALVFVATIGGITMLLAALLALVQNDIKRVLAYSTISQLAYMVASLGVGEAGYTPGLFHLFTHAFFKALLFLGAGSVIHAVHTNNMSEMGGLRKHMPITFVTFLVATVALAGIPPFAGFWSKDEIIAAHFRDEGYVLWVVSLLTAFLTALYMTRAVLLTFFGDYRGDARLHESPRAMTWPMIALAVLSAGAGFLGAPFVEGGFPEWVHFGHGEHAPFSIGLAALSVAVAAAGGFLGYRLYRTYRSRDPMLALGPFHALLERKFFLDDFYVRGIVRPVQYALSSAVNWTNQNVLDGTVNAAGWIARKLGSVVNAIDRRGVDAAVNGIAFSTGASGGLLKYIQSGNVQRYAVFLFAGVAVLAVAINRV